MADTPKLEMPEISESQSSKYVTHNEALRILDALVLLTVKDKDLSEPPGGESDGDTYIVGGTSSSSSDWNGEDDNIAYYKDSAYIFITPQEGWLAYVQDENQLYIYTGESASPWRKFNFTDLGDTPSDLSTSGYKQLRVNSGATALEFTEADYDIAAHVEGVPTASQVILRRTMVRAVGFDTDFVGSYGKAGTAAGDSAGAEFSIQVDGLEIGTMSFASGATVATFDSNSALTNLAAGDVLTVVAPASPDSALAGVSFVLKGTKV